LFWAPKAGKRWELQGSYGHSYLRSNIGYFAPQDLSPQTSLYTDNSHTATALFTANLPGFVPRAPHALAKLTGQGDAVLHRRSFERNERDDVGCDGGCSPCIKIDAFAGEIPANGRRNYFV
jgi:hypothetical protein